MSGDIHALSSSLLELGQSISAQPINKDIVAISVKDRNAIVTLLDSMAASARNLELEVNIFRLLENNKALTSSAEKLATQQLAELRRPKVAKGDPEAFTPIKGSDDLKPGDNVVKPDFGRKPEN